MDGTHVCVKVPPELQGMYWNRHDNASLNILAICDLNMLFTYIYGMEHRDLVMIQLFSQWHKKAILNFLCLQWISIMSLTRVIHTDKDFWLHISNHETMLSDIICHSSTMVLLHGIKKNYL
ncbi:unnamed protein product, partial [Brassica rapa subsp. narinosa]